MSQEELERKWADLNKVMPKNVSVEEIEAAITLEKEAFSKWVDHKDEPKEVRDKYWYRYAGILDVMQALGLV